MSKSESGKVTMAVAIGVAAYVILKWSLRIAFVLSVICILLMDVVMGAVALDKVIVSSPQVSAWFVTIHIPVALLCTGFSMAATAIRMSMWEMLIHGKSQSMTGWLFLTAIAVLNTLIDLAVRTSTCLWRIAHRAIPKSFQRCIHAAGSACCSHLHNRLLPDHHAARRCSRLQLGLSSIQKVDKSQLT